MTTRVWVDWDRESRLITVLSGVTVLFAALAVWVLAQRAGQAVPEFAPRPLFPSLEDRLNAVAAIDVSGPGGAVTVQRSSDGSWIVEGADFPARIEAVRRTLLGLADLELTEPRTDNPDWLHYLDLTAPEDGGEATRVTVRNNEGAALADVLLGSVPDGLAGIGGRSFVHVRRPEEVQAWLARGRLDPGDTAEDWLLRTLYRLSADAISRVEVAPLSGEAYTLSRSEADPGAFALAPVPEGKIAGPAFQLTRAATSLATLDISDVAPEADLALAETSVVRVQTNDGLRLVLEAADIGGQVWAKVRAENAAPPEASAEAGMAVARQAQEINRLATGRVFQIPAPLGPQLLERREAYLSDPPEAEGDVDLFPGLDKNRDNDTKSARTVPEAVNRPPGQPSPEAGDDPEPER